MLSTAVILSALAGLVVSTNLAGYDTNNVGPSNANCERKTYNISVKSNNTLFNTAPEASETELAAYFQMFTGSLPGGDNFTRVYIEGYKEVSDTYGISGIWCTPKKGALPGKVQLLVHGIGFDASYWHFGGSGIPSNYSYVEQASKAGYSTFRYDRLGTGMSDHPSDAYGVVQAPTDVAILVEIAAQIASGKIGGEKGVKIVAVGHSYGSVQVNALTRITPDVVEGIVLTGFTFNATAIPLYVMSAAYSTATGVMPSRWNNSAALPAPYLVSLAPQTNQPNFYWYPYYLPQAATIARATEQPVTQGVLFTFLQVGGSAPDFKGFVYSVTGDHDWIFCLNNCYAVPEGSKHITILDYIGDEYPKAKSFESHVALNTGHGISAHATAPQLYQMIQGYLKGQKF